MRTYFITALIACAATSAAGAPTSLKCAALDGERVADLIVDLSEKRMSWGGMRYIVSDVGERYVSAYQDPSYGGVGGEIFVFNRITGAYTRATVFMGVSAVTAAPETGKLVAKIYEGKCSAPIL